MATKAMGGENHFQQDSKKRVEEVAKARTLQRKDNE